MFALAVLAARASTARAEDADQPVPAAAPAAASATAGDSFVLPAGKLLLDAQLELNLTSGAAFKPVSLAPDLWYGVNDDLSLGLVHSGLAETGFIGAVGDSLCFTGSSNGCAHVYNKVGLDGRYRLAKPFALDAGLYINSISDPFMLDLKVGIDGRWSWDKVSLELQPSLLIGLTNRSPATVMGMAVGTGNSEYLYIPATLAYRVAPRADLAFQTGLVLPFTDTSNAWAIPLAIAGRYALSPNFGLGLAFSFPDLIGGNSTADVRTLTLGGTYAF
ncbi:MAG: hypothetical protein ABI467_09325 [Kofleriaceae bacterium]